MTDVGLRDYVLSLLAERDKALSLLATDLTRRLDQTYVTNQGLETRIERLASQIVEELKVVRNEHHALANRADEIIESLKQAALSVSRRLGCKQ